MTGTFFTLGGGGFSMSEDGSSLLDDYLLTLVDKPRPKVCFVGTASGDSSTYIERFLRAFESRADATVCTLFAQRDYDYTDPSMLLDQDIVYVGGGSVANLLALWRLHGVDEVLEQAAAQGVVLAGISAGMNCWFEASSTDSFGSLSPLHDGLGFLPGSACPHYSNDDCRAENYPAWIANGALPPGYAADDGVALLWRDSALIEAVSERADGRAFRVDAGGESAVTVRYLG